MTSYIGILDGSGDVWGVRFPDCPGAYGAGNTAEAAIHNAIEGLALWADGARKEGLDLPRARTVAEIMNDADGAPDNAAGEIVVMVPLLLDSGRTVRANITVDAGMLDAIDAEAERRGLTRSAFLVSAARDKIARNDAISAYRPKMRRP